MVHMHENVFFVFQESCDFGSASVKGDGLQRCDAPGASYGKDLASGQQSQQQH